MSVHARAAEVGGAAALSKRGQSMLELVVDIKNNRCVVVTAFGGLWGNGLGLLRSVAPVLTVGVTLAGYTLSCPRA